MKVRRAVMKVRITVMKEWIINHGRQDTIALDSSHNVMEVRIFLGQCTVYCTVHSVYSTEQSSVNQDPTLKGSVFTQRFRLFLGQCTLYRYILLL